MKNIKITHHSVKRNGRIFVIGYGFFFARNMGKTIAKNISKNLSGNLSFVIRRVFVFKHYFKL